MPKPGYPNFGTLDMIAAGYVPNAVPTTIAASSNWQSGIITQGMNPIIGATVLSSQAGTLTIQKYADLAGTVPTGTPVTQALTANAAASALASDAQPYLTFQITISNSGTSTANVSGITILTASSGGL